MKKPNCLTALLVLSALVLPGCINTNETVYRDPERMKVEFENETAAQTFHEAMNIKRSHSSEKRTELSIPIVFHHKRTEVDSGNTAFNQAVRRCDTNKDGRITEVEARIFAAHGAK